MSQRKESCNLDLLFNGGGDEGLAGGAEHLSDNGDGGGTKKSKKSAKMSDRFHPSRLFGSWPKKSASVGAKTAMKPDSATLLTIDDNAAIGLEDGINEMKKATKRYTDAEVQPDSDIDQPARTALIHSPPLLEHRELVNAVSRKANECDDNPYKASRENVIEEGVKNSVEIEGDDSKQL